MGSSSSNGGSKCNHATVLRVVLRFYNMLFIYMRHTHMRVRVCVIALSHSPLRTGMHTHAQIASRPVRFFPGGDGDDGVYLFFVLRYCRTQRAYIAEHKTTRITGMEVTGDTYMLHAQQ